jgi:hypothetical protein
MNYEEKGSVTTQSGFGDRDHFVKKAPENGGVESRAETETIGGRRENVHRYGVRGTKRRGEAIYGGIVPRNNGEVTGDLETMKGLENKSMQELED